MATCPECDADLDVDEYDVDKGDLLSCPECGTNLEVVSVSPLELEAAQEDDDEDDDDLDDDDDVGDEEEDEDEDEEGGLGPVNEALRSKRDHLAGLLGEMESILVAYSGGCRQRLSRVRRHCRASGCRALRDRRQSELSPPTPRARGAHRARVRAPARDHPYLRARAPRVSREPREPLLLLQARALHAPDGARARAPHRGGGRRQQRRRPRRLPARAARRRGNSACAARSTRPG